MKCQQDMPELRERQASPSEGRLFRLGYCLLGQGGSSGAKFIGKLLIRVDLGADFFLVVVIVRQRGVDIRELEGEPGR